MRDLRVRFGFVLAMALLPLLVFTIWRSFNDYNYEKETRNAIIEHEAIRTVADVIHTLDTIKAILKTTSQAVTMQNCDAELKRVTENFSMIYNMIMADSSGQSICYVTPARNSALIKSTLGTLTPDNNYNIEIHTFNSDIEGPRSVLVTSLGVFKDGKLEYIFRAGSNLSKLSSFTTESELLENINVSIFSRSGDFIVGGEAIPPNIAPSIIQNWATQVIENGRHSATFTNASGEHRDITIIPTREAELFVALNAPRASFITMDKVHPVSSALIPLLAWAFAFVAIWIVTNKLLINHLHPMNQAARKYANGEYEARVGKLKDAPTQIQELASTLDAMAESISERDRKLTESLSEKETLLREIHHRVKNNLQIIISLLNMQTRQLKNPKYTEAITETRNRINAIALVHKALYESDDIREVEMQPFLEQLISQVGRALVTDMKNIQVEVDIDCRPRDADRATTIAMFIVEAMTNSVKHGVLNGGHIWIKVKDHSEETIVSIEDNGESDLTNMNSPKKGTGERLMKGFARQLSGEYWGGMTETGYKASLTFPNTLKIL